MGGDAIAGYAWLPDDAPAAEETVVIQTAAASPVREVARLALSYPEEVVWSKPFGLTVTNTGNLPFALDVPEGENCLSVRAETGFLAIYPDLTCDVLMVQILEPGESVYYGSWDLKVCADEICAARVPAPAGVYSVELMARPFDGAELVVQRAEFQLIGEAPAAAQTPRSPAGELVWLLTADLGTEQSFHGELAPGAAETIFLHMSGLGQGSPNASSRRVVLTLQCEGLGVLNWFHEHYQAASGYPVRSATFGCGDRATVYFTIESNSQTIGLSLPAEASGLAQFTLTAAIHSPA